LFIFFLLSLPGILGDESSPPRPYMLCRPYDSPPFPTAFRSFSRPPRVCASLLAQLPRPRLGRLPYLYHTGGASLLSFLRALSCKFFQFTGHSSLRYMQTSTSPKPSPSRRLRPTSCAIFSHLPLFCPFRGRNPPHSLIALPRFSLASADQEGVFFLKSPLLTGRVWPRKFLQDDLFSRRPSANFP